MSSNILYHLRTSDATIVFCHCMSQDFQICSSITLSEY
ncbi:hypothetical protein T4A_97 [Trichinella pseudospiralis]|uniref:Uncharacterized protein n=1 Tax=Trichinella pseudospiralis TaxID=6337 RepID=A0A0V1CNP6_TRIPS|nr:hypothetical protein T4A_4466 [Trichinella pseudospiralis]KRY62268.1 hypothetical protein T4A_5356 [Trichinella pseudospiralis]KRY62283.1 hypothetical protein T4A_97 [Trichinella pseudospiralis]